MVVIAVEVVFFKAFDGVCVFWKIKDRFLIFQVILIILWSLFFFFVIIVIFNAHVSLGVFVGYLARLNEGEVRGGHQFKHFMQEILSS